MPIADVLASQAAAEICVKQEKLINGADCKLQIFDHFILRKKYTVNLYFLMDRLTQVTITKDDDGSIADFDELRILLTAKYGIPIHQNHDSVVSGASWMTDQQANISLIYLAHMKMINITYQAQILMEFDNI